MTPANAARPSAVPSDKSKNARPTADWGALTSKMETVLVRSARVRERDEELFRKLLEIDPNLFSPARLGGEGPSRALIESTWDEFIRSHQSDYDALDAAHQQLTQLLLQSDFESQILLEHENQTGLAKMLFDAYRSLGHTRFSGVAVQWVDRLLTDRASSDGRLYRAMSAAIPDFDQALTEKVLLPALPNVAETLYEQSQKDAQEAIERVALLAGTGAGMLKALALLINSHPVGANGRDIAVAPAARDKHHYGRASPLVRALGGPGNTVGILRALVDLTRHQYLSAVRQGVQSSAAVTTFAAEASQSIAENPHLKDGWRKKAATWVANGGLSKISEPAIRWSPALGALGASLSLADHASRPEPSLSARVSVLGDSLALGGSAFALATNLTAQEAVLLTLRRLTMMGWYGVGLSVTGELYETGRKLRAASDAADPSDSINGLKRFLGLKPKSVVLDD